MSSLARRLAAVEQKLAPSPSLYQGSYEIHWLAAWPACEGTPGMEPCAEHPSACGVKVFATRAPGRQSIILRGGPWLGLD